MKIDHKVPLPAKSQDRKRGYSTAKKGQSKYAFGEMKRKDSFPVPVGKRHSVITLAKKYGETQFPVKKFIVRPDDNGNLRCWRTK
jgi:hypothetical protein